MVEFPEPDEFKWFSLTTQQNGSFPGVLADPYKYGNEDWLTNTDDERDQQFDAGSNSFIAASFLTGALGQEIFAYKGNQRYLADVWPDYCYDLLHSPVFYPLPDNSILMAKVDEAHGGHIVRIPDITNPQIHTVVFDPYPGPDQYGTVLPSLF